MPKKNQNNNSDDHLSKNFDNVTNLWSDFSSQMEDKLHDLFESSAAEYKDIYDNWTDISDKMSKQVLEFSTGNDGFYQNLYNSWKEYSERLSSDLGKVTNNEDKTQSEFLNFWTNYSENFNDKLSELVRDGFKQYELYELWMDTFAKSAQNGSKTSDLPSIVNKYWLDVFSRFGDFYKTNKSADQNFTTEPGEMIYKQYQELYNYWLDSSQKMMDDVMRSPLYGNILANSINSSMDYKKMFENSMIQNIKSVGIPTKNELDDIHYELKSLSDRMDELNQTLKELKKR